MGIELGPSGDRGAECTENMGGSRVDLHSIGGPGQGDRIQPRGAEFVDSALTS